jgi:ribosomal protein S18 acetylase RimI-like enzyme
VGSPAAATWYLGLIFLVPEARGRGLGGQLLEDVCAAVRERGGRALRLAVVPTNTGARRLYDRLGFAFVARRPRTGWNGVVVEVDVLERTL